MKAAKELGLNIDHFGQVQVVEEKNGGEGEGEALSSGNLIMTSREEKRGQSVLSPLRYTTVNLSSFSLEKRWTNLLFSFRICR